MLFCIVGSITNIYSRTALMLAATNGYIDSASLLIGQGCNVIAHDLFQRTALHAAVSLIILFYNSFILIYYVSN